MEIETQVLISQKLGYNELRPIKHLAQSCNWGRQSLERPTQFTSPKV